ncbi:tail fiber repeat 2-containing protein [Yersinia intermedia]|uniref:phage tail protein n=1 Tax=Yersinia intermedia TaxID=631 RepID=UPI0005E92AF7|nr:phage tail protein [Yersinia intermedia]CNI83784.1 tail fiber repeat 2-containing protein [Yersinia intermedia]
MHRIDTPTAQVDKFGAGKNGFTRGNPQTGVPATALDDDYFDAVQEELAGIVEAAGIVLDKTNRAQLLTAIQHLITLGIPDLKDASLTQKGIVQLSSSTNSTSQILAATPKAVSDLGNLLLKITNNLSEIKDAGPAAVAQALANLGGLKTTNNLSEIAAAGSAAQAAARGNLGVVSTDKKQLVTAWVNFSVSGGVVTINDSFNVSSVVRTATGRFNVFFTNAMINSFYCPAVISRRPTAASTEDGICYSLGNTNRAMNATQFPISINNAVGTAEDPLFCCVSVSGGV